MQRLNAAHILHTRACTTATFSLRLQSSNTARDTEEHKLGCTVYIHSVHTCACTMYTQLCICVFSCSLEKAGLCLSPREFRDSADCRISAEFRKSRGILQKREKKLLFLDTFDVRHSPTNQLVAFKINLHGTFWSFQFFGPGFHIILIQN